METVVNSTPPKGGVTMPMVMVTQKTTAKCIGSRPIASPTGIRMGAKMTTALKASSTQPATSRMSRKATQKKKVLPFKTGNSVSTICAGIFAAAIIQQKILDIPIRKPAIALASRDFLNTSTSFFHVKDLYTMPSTTLYIAPMAPASVGVKIPP